MFSVIYFGLLHLSLVALFYLFLKIILLIYLSKSREKEQKEFLSLSPSKLFGLFLESLSTLKRTSITTFFKII